MNILKNLFFLIGLLTAPLLPAQGLLQKAQEARSTSVAADTFHEGVVRAGELQAGLVAEYVAVMPGEPITVGLRLIHDPHWHTYWRNPGDSGLATQIEWQLPPGWRAGPIQWPVPRRIPVGPLANFGFEGELLLMVELTPPASILNINTTSGSDVRLKAKASWLVCKDVCIPGEAQLALRLPVASDAKSVAMSAVAPLFSQARAALPKKELSRAPKAWIDTKTLTLFWASDSLSDNQAPGFFYPYSEALIQTAAAQRFSKTAQGWRVDITLGESSAAALEQIRKTKIVEGVWVVPGQGAWEWRAALASEAPPVVISTVSEGATAKLEGSTASDPTDWSGFWLAAVGALIGGAILNLMPCVFPVIGLKVLSFAQAAHSRRGAMRQSIAFSFGVIASFIVLAAILIGLRAAGDSVGWGFQLQNPVVVMLLVLLFVAVAVNLLGGFEIGLLAVRAGNLELAERAASLAGSAGSFFSGVLAVVVASPCTAPFMGGAIGFTATATTFQTLLVFGFLGLGMSLPYLLLAAWPGLLKRMPRPGSWMVRFKQLMAFPMLLAAAWLVWVLSTIQGVGALLPALAAAILLAFALWIYGATIQQGRAGLLSWLGVLLAVILLALSMTQAVSGASESSRDGRGISPISGVAEGTATTNLVWQPWAPGLPERLAGQGNTVLVDFTASWCISCQANKIRVLQSESVIKALLAADVKTVRADWTRKDAEIAAELTRHGRSGVPLYLVYPKSGGAPKVLSEWLTEKELLSAIR